MAEVGRPTSYNDEIPGRVQEYLSLCVDETKDVISGESEKFTSYKQKTIVKLPTIEGLAVYIGVHKDTINEWSKTHPEFSVVIHTLKAMQAERLINMGLSGDYNPVIAKVLLSKHGYADRTELTGADGSDLMPPVVKIEVVKPDSNGIVS